MAKKKKKQSAEEKGQTEEKAADETVAPPLGTPAADKTVPPPVDTPADDGIVTSAPASSVGSLLTDLLSEAQREADEERANLRDQISARNAEETAQKKSSEAVKREEMQRRLIEETRKRNEVLTRKQRAEATAQAIKDAKPLLASADSVGDFEGQARNASASKTWMIIGVVALIGVAVLAFMYVGTTGKLDEANTSNATQKADNDKLTKEAGELTSKVSSLETSLTATQGELSQATSDRKTAEEAKAKLDVSMTDTNAKLKAANEEIQTLKEAAEQAGSVKNRPGKRSTQQRGTGDRVKNRPGKRSTQRRGTGGSLKDLKVFDKY